MQNSMSLNQKIWGQAQESAFLMNILCEWYTLWETPQLSELMIYIALIYSNRFLPFS